MLVFQNEEGSVWDKMNQRTVFHVVELAFAEETIPNFSWDRVSFEKLLLISKHTILIKIVWKIL